MIKAMRTAATGMVAQQMNVDTIANNLANVNTSGFKKVKIEFQDVLYQNFRRAGSASALGTSTPTGLAVGYGARPAATVRQFTPGDLQQTGAPLDLAIEGDGFFQIQRPDGGLAYTRDGSFKLDGDGRVVTTDGYFMVPELTIPEDTVSIAIGKDGTIEVMQVGQDDPSPIGQIELARFVNPAGLSAIGRNLLVLTSASGDPTTDIPGQGGNGEISQG